LDDEVLEITGNDTHFSLCATPPEDRPHFTRYDVPPHMIVDDVTSDALWPKAKEESWADGIKWGSVDGVNSGHGTRYGASGVDVRVRRKAYVKLDGEISIGEGARIMGTSASGFVRAANRHGLTVKEVYVNSLQTKIYLRSEVEALAKTGWRR
jgi:hypothetical protein